MNTVERLRSGITKSGKTIRAIAVDLEINERTLRSYLSGERSPALPMQDKLEKGLALPPGSLAVRTEGSAVFQEFMEKSPLAQSDDLALLREGLRKQFDDTALLELGAPADWRLYEHLLVVMDEVVTLYRRKEAVLQAIRSETESEERNRAVLRRRT